MTVEEDNQRSIDRLCADLGVDVIREAQKIIREEDRIYKEDLVNGFGYDPSRKRVYNNRIYARVTEFGFPRGRWIPVEKLRQWVKDKLNTSTDRETNAITYSVKKKIHDQGIMPIFYMLRAIQRVVNR